MPEQNLDAKPETKAKLEHDSAPQLCAHCLAILTMTPAQLDEYIVLIAKQATRVGWPEEIAIEKLRKALRCGDSVAWIGYGVLTVKRADGELLSVYLRDS